MTRPLGVFCAHAEVLGDGFRAPYRGGDIEHDAFLAGAEYSLQWGHGIVSRSALVALVGLSAGGVLSLDFFDSLGDILADSSFVALFSPPAMAGGYSHCKRTGRWKCGETEPTELVGYSR
jgi:hypothetical protein